MTIIHSSVTVFRGSAMDVTFAAIHYRTSRDRIRAQDPEIEEQTLAEGLTNLHEILTAVICGALVDQGMATGLDGRITEMQTRRNHLQDRAAKRRQMVELDLKKLTAPDFSASIPPSGRLGSSR
jgi:hypothetical protein